MRCIWRGSTLFRFWLKKVILKVLLPPRRWTKHFQIRSIMFNIFSKNTNGPTDVKGVRDVLLRGNKEELQKAEGGEGRNIKGINLFIAENTGEKHLYEAAVYLD